MEKLLRSLVKASARLYYNCTQRSNKRDYIPASGKVLGVEELDNMIDATLDMWLTSGRFNDEFEKEFSKYLGVKYVSTVNSGSSANLLAISALMSPKLGKKRLKKGDEVITTAAGFPTTVNPIVQNGLIPVFVDCETKTYNLDISKIEEAITPKTKAIIAAHTLGHPFDIVKAEEIADRHGLWLIEDSCDALGAEVNGKKTGTIGHIGTFSFYPAHHITMGEGGAVVTNDPVLHKIILSMRDWGRDCFCKPGKDDTCKNRFNMQLGNLPFGYDHKYTYSHVGYNLKITDWQAACALAQLKKLPYFLKKRQENAQYLTQKLAGLEDFLLLPYVSTGIKSGWFGYLISVKENAPFTKQQLVEYLENNGVGTRQLFAGNILRQPMFSESEIPLRICSSDILYSNQLNEEHYKMLPQTEFVMNNTFWVGVFPALGQKELDKTADTIREFIELTSLQ